MYNNRSFAVCATLSINCCLLLIGSVSFADTPASQQPVPAPSISPLTPDRPGFTNSAEVVIAGQTQIETGIAQTNAAASNGGGSVTDYPEMLVRIGLTPRLEARIGLPDYFSHVGFSDGSMGVKYKFYQSRDGNTKLSLTPSLSIPVGVKSLTTGHVDPSLTLGGQTVSGSRWGISGNLALSAPTENGSRVTNVAPSTAVSYQITAALASYGELYDNFAKSSLPSPITDGGFTYLVNPNMQFDAEVGYGLGGAAPARFSEAALLLGSKY